MEEERPAKQGEFNFESGQPELPTHEEERQQMIRNNIEEGRRIAAAHARNQEREAERRHNRPNEGIDPSEARRDQTSEVLYPNAPSSAQHARETIEEIQAEKEQTSSDSDHEAG